MLKLRKYIAYFLALIMVYGFTSICYDTYAQKKQTQKVDPFSRPKPTKPIEPTIPSANRYQEGKVFLERADSLFTTPFEGRDCQILKGDVVFRQGGMWMYCDSAYYYPASNSMDAFGNVRLEQGDTLKGWADVVYYNGNSRMAKMRKKGSKPVKLQNRDVTLVTDSLDYSVIQQLGWYDHGGTLHDNINTLTSINGSYSPATKIAEFNNNVHLVNRKDGYVLDSEKLIYNTTTSIATISTPTTIVGANDTIRTSNGEYNARYDQATLNSRSLIIHRDSANNVVTLEGDSIIYDKLTHTSRAYSFRDPRKDAMPMVLTDTAHKAILIGGFGYYNDSTKQSYATDYPQLKEYSRADTLFLRADTIRTWIIQKNIATLDSLTKNTQPISGDTLAMQTIVVDTIFTPKEFYMAQASPRARFFRPDIQGVADTIRFEQTDSMLYMLRKPVVWSDQRQISGNSIHVHFNDSTADWALLPETGIIAEHVADEFYNQLSGKKILATLNNGELENLYVEGDARTIFLPAEEDSSFNKLVATTSRYLSMDMSSSPPQNNDSAAPSKRELEKLKIWPEVEGAVTPIYMVKTQEQYLLPGFKWLDMIRPKRIWYVDESKLGKSSVRWEDDLGDISEELEKYFEE